MDLIHARDLLLGLWDKEEDDEEDDEEEEENGEDEEEKGQVLEQVKESELEQRKQEYNEEDEQVETKQGLAINKQRKRTPLAPEQRKRLLTPHSLWTKVGAHVQQIDLPKCLYGAAAEGQRLDEVFQVIMEGKILYDAALHVCIEYASLVRSSKRNTQRRWRHLR